MDIKSKILIVDDTPLNIRVLGETLREDYTVMAATSGAKALQLCARENKPDLILLDVMMPEMNGHEVLSRLLCDPTTAGIPVIFVTVLSEEHDEERGLSLGAVDYITKPFNPALVKARIRNHLELKRHRDHLESEVQKRTDQLLAVRQNQARLEGELETARRLQLSMLRERNFNFGNRGELTAFLNPARSVGGDLFDYTLVGDRQVLLCLGDVSDKGTSAALFMVKTLTLIRAFLDFELQPDKLLEKVNNSLCQFNDEYMFVTLTCCLLDLTTGELCWASGGHEPLLKFGKGECDFLPQETGPALGLMEDATFPLQRELLLPGQGIVLYSDGITEAQGSDEIEFGKERFLAAVHGLTSPTPQELCNQLLAKLEEFIKEAEQFDDMALMAMNWRGTNS